MSRKYLVFGSRDGVSWKPIGTVDANSHSQAQDTAADQVPGYEQYGSTPFRSWKARSVAETKVRNWSAFDVADTGQLSLAHEARLDELVEEAKDALGKTPTSTPSE